MKIENASSRDLQLAGGVRDVLAVFQHAASLANAVGDARDRDPSVAINQQKHHMLLSSGLRSGDIWRASGFSADTIDKRIHQAGSVNGHGRRRWGGRHDDCSLGEQD